MDEKKNTTEELKNTSSEEEAKKNLNDEELDKVSGGGFGVGLLPEDMFRQVG